MEKKIKKTTKTSIGGQAVIEGVMMRGKTSIATAVRDSEGTIRLEAERLPKSNKKFSFLKLPVIRGAVNFFSSLVTGMKILMRSAEVYGVEEGEPTKFEKWLAKTFKIDVTDVALFLGVALGLVFSVGLFFILPTLIGSFFGSIVPNLLIVRNLIEGLVRIAIFVCYILFTTALKDIRRTYMYHGAEHKTITCFEKGLDLTVENVKTCRRVHDRCGTTFMFFVMFVSVLVYSVFGAIFPPLNANMGLRILSRVILLPLIAGISYELLKLLAKTDSPLVLPLKLPGLALQKLTTKEPDDQMIEVAITAFKKVLKMDADESESECRFVIPEKINDITERVKGEFAACDIDASDAEWLIAIAVGVKRDEVYGDRVVKASKIDEIERLKQKRLSGEPLCYVLGNCDFYGFELNVDKNVLIPRPETEELVENAIREISEKDSVLDLCAGSGAIALVVKKKTNALVTASDISVAALEVAKSNFKKFNADIKTLISDLYEGIEEKFDVIISNPPYIKTQDIDGLDEVVKNFEPRLALDGGVDGLDFYRRIARGAKARLNDGGRVFLEVGDGQAEDVAKMFDGEFETAIIKDICGKDRIVKAVLL